MAILRVRDENGNVTEIPAIKGDPGKGVPEVTTSDNGKFLQVVNGEWAVVDATQQVVAIVNAVMEEALGGDY